MVNRNLNQTISELMRQDHQQLSALLQRLLFALDAPDQPGTFALLDLFWARLAVHIRAENLCLFPTLSKAVAQRPGNMPTPEDLQSVIETLRSDHNFFMDQLAKAVNMLRKAASHLDDAQGMNKTGEQVRGIVVAVAERLRVHDRLEEEQVYKWTDAILGAAEANTLNASLRHELNNMPPRFRP